MKKLALKPISFSVERLLSILPYLTISISIIVLVYTGWFIYNNIIIAANDAVELKSLNQQVVKIKLNVNLYELVNTEFTKKTEGTVVDISNIRNPFEEINDTSKTIKIEPPSPNEESNVLDGISPES